MIQVLQLVPWWCRATWRTATSTAPPENVPDNSELFYLMAVLLQSFMDMASQGLRPSLEDEPGLEPSMPSVRDNLSALGDA